MSTSGKSLDLHSFKLEAGKMYAIQAIGVDDPQRVKVFIETTNENEIEISMQ